MPMRACVAIPIGALGVRITLTPMDLARAKQAAEEGVRRAIDAISQDPAWQAQLDLDCPLTGAEVREFYIGRKRVGRQIDLMTAEVTSWWAQMLDPYRLGLDSPDAVCWALSFRPRACGRRCISVICRTRRCRCSIVAHSLYRAA